MKRKYCKAVLTHGISVRANVNKRAQQFISVYSYNWNVLNFAIFLHKYVPQYLLLQSKKWKINKQENKKINRKIKNQQKNNNKNIENISTFSVRSSVLTIIIPMKNIP